MPTSKLLCSVSTRVAVSKVFDTQQVVKKPTSYIRFGVALPDDAIRLAFAATSEISPDKNLHITHHNDTIASNAVFDIEQQEVFSGAEFQSRYRNILFTDVFTDVALSTQDRYPLFYAHYIPIVTSGTFTEEHVSKAFILDSNFNKVSPATYVVQLEERLAGADTVLAVYSNYQNKFNSRTGDLTTYYLQYIDETNTPHTVLLSNEPAFHLATFEDINWDTFLLYSWARAYTVAENTEYYTFVLPDAGKTYAVKYGSFTGMKVYPPAVSDPELPWFVRISNSSFTNTVDAQQYRYSIPEFTEQNFTPAYPYRKAIYEQATIVSDNLIQVAHQQIAASYPLDIYIRSKAGALLYVLTTDGGKVGDIYNDTETGEQKVWSSSEILSADPSSGLIHLNLITKDYYQIYCTYNYTEEFLELTALNLNPLYTANLRNYMYVVFVKPGVGGATVEKGIFYLRVNTEGNVVDCSDEIEYTMIGSPTRLLPYGRPIGASTDTFLQRYSCEGDNENQYLILAEITLANSIGYKDTVLIDARTLGGGIVVEKIEEAKLLNKNVNFYNDIGAGQGILCPTNGALVIRLPFALLKKYGGLFEQEDIETIVHRHLGLGSYPIIRFYGETQMLHFGINASGVQYLYWDPAGEDFTYDLYLAPAGTGNFVKLNTSPIDDEHTSFLLSTVYCTPGTTYLAKLVATCLNPCNLPLDPTLDELTTENINRGMTGFSWGFLDRAHQEASEAWVNREKLPSNIVSFVFRG